jgi:phosphotransferase system  glucose/maltose/N-acetylglucosamine-specific IIC component
MTLEDFVVALSIHVINPIIRLLFAVAGLVFFWGLFNYVRFSDSDEERKKGSSHMMYGIIGLFIMVAVYGIMYFLINSLGLDRPPGL